MRNIALYLWTFSAISCLENPILTGTQINNITQFSFSTGIGLFHTSHQTKLSLFQEKSNVISQKNEIFVCKLKFEAATLYVN